MPRLQSVKTPEPETGSNPDLIEDLARSGTAEPELDRGRLEQPQAEQPVIPDDTPIANPEAQPPGQTEPVAEPATEPAAEPPKKATKSAAKKSAPTARPGGAGSKPADGALSLPGLSQQREMLSIGWYGREGSGKTSAALTMANFGRCVLVNAEAGAKASALRRRGIDVDNIRVWPNYEAGEEFSFDGLERLFFQIKADLERDPDSWFGCVWDSLTEIAYRFVNNERDRNRVQKAAEHKNVDRFFMDRSFYGVSTSQIQELVRRFRDLPWNFALCALERRDTDDDGKVAYGPAVNPALATDIPGFVDILIHAEVVEVDGAGERGSGTDEYRGWSRVHGKYRAKDRFGVLPKAIPDPTFERIYGYFVGDMDADSDPVLAAIRAKRQTEAKGAEPNGQPPTEGEAARD